MNRRAFAFLLLGLAALSCEHRPMAERPKTASVDPLVARMMVRDSGFITKKEGLPWLLKSGLADTIDAACRRHQQAIAASDTIGKFFRVVSSNEVLVYCSTLHNCTERTGEFALCMVATDGKILCKEFDTNSRRTCGKHLNYFRKTGAFFTLADSYFYGPGFCRTDINCFKQLPAGADGSIVADFFLSGTELIRGDTWATLSLGSTISFSHDTLLMHYQQREQVYALSDDHLMSDSTQRFVVKFVRGAQGWQALDSSRYRRFCEEM